MSAYSYWESNSKDLFGDLQINFTVNTMCSFLQSIWLGESLSVFYAGGMPKAVYMHGNPDEVYTQKERVFIERISDVIIFSGFTKKLRDNAITCRIVAADMRWSSNPLYDGIQFMKIFYKAFRNFNIFVFVVNEMIYLGCNLLGEQQDDCFISFPLQDAMDWEAFSDNMMYINDDAFIPFYHDLIDSIKSIKQFYTRENDASWEDEESVYSEKINYKRLMHSRRDLDVIEFECEVDSCKEKLSYIRSSTVNPLEILYEAEMAEKAAESVEEKIQTAGVDDISSRMSAAGDPDMIDLLYDPEALIKALKNRGGHLNDAKENIS